MSRKCAEHCGIMRLVDPRFAGVAVGIGEAKIVGSVRIAPSVIGKHSYNWPGAGGAAQWAMA